MLRVRKYLQKRRLCLSYAIDESLAGHPQPIYRECNLKPKRLDWLETGLGNCVSDVAC